MYRIFGDFKSVGVFVGMVCEHAVSEYVAQVQRTNPIPDVVKEVERAFGSVGDDVIEV